MNKANSMLPRSSAAGAVETSQPAAVDVDQQGQQTEMTRTVPKQTIMSSGSGVQEQRLRLVKRPSLSSSQTCMSWAALMKKTEARDKRR